MYSAILHINPQKTVVFTSSQGIDRLPEVISHSDYRNEIQPIILEDPFACFGDMDRVWPAVSNYIARYRDPEIYVNITGGTTAMQYLIQQTGKRLKELGYTVTGVAMIDRRSREQQLVCPYYKGELIFLKDF